MRQQRLIQFAALFLAAVSVLAASLLVGPIQQQRHDLQLGYGAKVDDSMPADTALAVMAFGAFRGFLIDQWWYQANELKDEGRYFKANQLARRITRFQPRSPHVWAFHAWNMAYNISVATHTREERWDWVNKGVRLIRDEGIPLNPNSVFLYRELAGYFNHKIAGYTDDMNWYYKAMLAFEWEQLLGPPHMTGRKQDAIDWFATIAAAPDTLDALYEEYPEARDLVDELAAAGYGLDLNLVQQTGRIIMLGRSLTARIANVRLVPKLETLNNIFSQPRYRAAALPLLNFARKKALIEDYHMDPAFMLELMEQYGPLDWRHPSAHAVYWSALGGKVASGLRRTDMYDVVNTLRITLHGLQDLMRSGSVNFDPFTMSIDYLPDPEFVESYEKAVQHNLELVAQIRGEDKPLTTYDAGYENFLIQAAVFSYLYGQPEKAQEYYDRARKRFYNPEDVGDQRRYELPLAQMVEDQIRTNSTMKSNMEQFVDAMLRSAFLQGLANGRQDVFDRFNQIARSAHETFQKENLEGSQIADVKRLRMAMAPFDEFRRFSYERLMKQQNLDLWLRLRIWRSTPIELQLASFNALREPLREEAAQMGLNPEAAFPTPPGWTPPKAQDLGQDEEPHRQGLETIERK